MRHSSLLLLPPCLAIAALIGRPDTGAPIGRVNEAIGAIRCALPSAIDLREFIGQATLPPSPLLSALGTNFESVAR